ncbi:bile acid:sodium symporter family protein [Virgibacillus sp. YIM 98842]|uniref:bile acid:sodium symporter family protein n=1 Tax=Virgibacillus sp. YIM 98842 TaxID=2663533 RepID=UPI0013DBBA9F|nr:bile acid:sodium symporter family protein [Virgibacillus sp. YIM 98842]
MQKLANFSQFAGNTFAVWVLLFALIAYYSPETFTWIAPYISILLGVVMFGMGLTLTAEDFKEVFKRPKDVAIGAGAQFIIMPLIAYVLAIGFQLPPEVAVGVILVGCCPGGTASNVMTYLARGDTPLSVSVTAASTILAPIMTPLLVWILASQWLPVSAGALFWDIVQVVIIPIVLGITLRAFFSKQVEKSVQVLPLVSVIAIVAIVAAVVGGNQENIAATGLLIFAVVILHNILGLALGYLTAKIFGLEFKKQKALSMEVGLQNSGLGATLATAHFAPIAAVPSAIFSVWHNISGPILATYWRRKALKEKNSIDQDKREQSQIVN